MTFLLIEMVSRILSISVDLVMIQSQHRLMCENFPTSIFSFQWGCPKQHAAAHLALCRGLGLNSLCRSVPTWVVLWFWGRLVVTFNIIRVHWLLFFFSFSNIFGRQKCLLEGEGSWRRRQSNWLNKRSWRGFTKHRWQCSLQIPHLFPRSAWWGGR